MVAALCSILVARLLGSTAYGFLGIALVPISIIGLFSDLGVGQGMIRFSAQYRAQGREEESRGVLVAGLLSQFLLGSRSSELHRSFFSSTAWSWPARLHSRASIEWASTASP